MNFKLFFPGKHGANDKHLADVGIEQLASDRSPDWEDCVQGVDNKRGMLASWRVGRPEIDAPLGIPDNYTWIPSPPHKERSLTKGAYYIGLDLENPPGPEHLKRSTQHTGLRVELHDGNKWIIPSALFAPHTLGIDLETGEKACEFEPEFKRYCDTAYSHAIEIFNKEEEIKLLVRMFQGGKLTKQERELLPSLAKISPNGKAPKPEDISVEQLSVKLELDDAIDHSFTALELNYRVTPALVTILKLLTRRSVELICYAALDIPAIQETLKKNEADLPISLVGGWSI